MILIEVLSNWGARPVAVSNGPAALDALRSAAAQGRPFAIVLVDGMMPEMDGLTVARHIRDDPMIAGVLMLMLTSSGPPEDDDICAGLQISACLTKPVRQSELLDAVMAALAQRVEPIAVPGKNRGDAHPAPAAPSNLLHVLLAEDHPVNQKVAVRMLERMGHWVVVVADGQQAVEALEGDDFDVVLMDLQMPRLDGLEALRAIREREAGRGRHTHVVALTAHAMQGDRERCLAAGFDNYLAKPVRQSELQAVLDAVHRPDQVADDSVVDGLREICDGDDEFARELATSFLESAPRCLAGIDEALRSSDGIKLAAEAHGLKGISRTIGAGAQAAACAALEQAARHGELGAGRDRGGTRRSRVAAFTIHARAIYELPDIAMNILIAEDQPPAALVLRRMLEKLGHQVGVAPDGETAWRIVCEGKTPILITDWMMPRLDGLDLCRRVRAAAGDHYTYIILLTARDRRD